MPPTILYQVGLAPPVILPTWLDWQVLLWYLCTWLDWQVPVVRISHLSQVEAVVQKRLAASNLRRHLNHTQWRKAKKCNQCNCTRMCIKGLLQRNTHTTPLKYQQGHIKQVKVRYRSELGPFLIHIVYKNIKTASHICQNITNRSSLGYIWPHNLAPFYIIYTKWCSL